MLNPFVLARLRRGSPARPARLPRLAGLRWSAAFSILLALVLTAPAHAQRRAIGENLPYSINADRVRFEQDREIYEADGNVRIEQEGGRTLDADSVMFNANTRIGVAIGNVVIRDVSDTVTGDFAVVDFATLRVLAIEALVVSERPGLTVKGDEIERTGEDTYRIANGLFTSCRCAPGTSVRPWDIKSSKADITVGGYAVARNVVFRTLGIPLLYTPIAIFPVKNERQSGFLIPNFSRSRRDGMALKVPFFWAARENLGITLTPTWFSRRGVKVNGDLEYVFDEEAYGKGGFAFLRNDKEIEDGDPAQSFSDNRYAFWLRHEQPLATGTRFGLDLKRISDNQFVVDFDDFSAQIRSARFLESQAWLSRASGANYLGVELALVDDLQSPNDLDRDEFLLQRLPDVHLSLLPRDLALPFGFRTRGSFDARYTYFYNRESPDTLRGFSPVGGQFFDTGQDGLFDIDEPNAAGVFDGRDNHGDNFGPNLSERDGLFQEGELLADRGHRLELYPKLSAVRRFGWIETLSELGLRETLFSADEAGSASRNVFTGRIDVRSRFQRRFQFGSLTLSHLVEPRIGLAIVDASSQERDPLFIPAATIRAERLIESDPRVLTRNPSDRIADERFLNFGLQNRLYGTPLAAGGPPREIGNLRIGSGYDFQDGRLTNVFLRGQFTPNPQYQFISELGYDPKDTRVEEASVILVAQGDKDYAFTSTFGERRFQAVLAYRYVRDREALFENFLRSDDIFDEFDRNLSRINQVSFNGKLILSRRIDVFLQGFLSLDDSSTRSGSIGLAFLSDCGCWEFRTLVEKRIRPGDTVATFEIRLAGIGK